MPQIAQELTVCYTQQQMFDLVCDVSAYPDFIPKCYDGSIIDTSVIDSDQQQVKASLGFCHGPLKIKFITQNTLLFNNRVDIELLSGPFRYLSGCWQFDVVDSASSRVKIDLSFECKNRLIAMILEKGLEYIAEQIVQVFCDRARMIYGSQNI